jgi:hypothetical protein
LAKLFRYSAAQEREGIRFGIPEEAGVAQAKKDPISVREEFVCRR